MPLKPPASINKLSNCFLPQQFLIYLMLFLFGSTLIGCNSANSGKLENPNDTNRVVRAALNTPKAIAPQESKFDTKLHILYINNTTDSNELERLFTVEGHGSKNAEKIVFQFFYKKDGSLSLAAFPGKKNSGKTDYNEKDSAFILRISSNYPDTGDYDMSGKNVFLDNMEINVENEHHKPKSDIDSLYCVKNKKDYEYIIFTPHIVLAKGTNTYRICYKIGYQSTNPNASNAAKTAATSLGISTNPSPPRESY